MKFTASVKRKLEELFRDKDGLCVLQLENIDFELILNKPYTNSFHELFFLTKGTLTHSIDGMERPISTGEICVLEQGHVHKIISRKNIKGFLLRYKNEFIPSGGASYKTTFYACLKGYLGDNEHHLKITIEEIERCTNLLQLLESEFRMKGNFSVNKGIVQHLLIALILILERRARINETERTANTNSHEKTVYHNFIRLLEKHFIEEHSMTFYAQQLGLSRRKLSELVKKFEKKTIKRLHVERIMLEAKRLLAYSNLSLKQIAFHLGFEHAPYFSNKFKEEFGITPNQYRMETQSIAQSSAQ